MKAIEADDADGIALELETWTRTTANEERFAGALVLVLRSGAPGGAHFSVASDNPNARLQLGGMMMHLGKQMAEAALREGAKPPELPKHKRLVGIS